MDYSEDGVEGGDAVFSLLSSEEYSPFWKFMQSDILDLPAGVFDASGQDTVVLTVSVLNKIPELPTDFFVKIRNLVCHARRIDMVIVESVGW
ncbi:MAG: hypothetical protein ISP41_19245 [Alphaproteobacteria bacterium]|nr:hypothetical protein [Alphaproteobacteria bacterium]